MTIREGELTSDARQRSRLASDAMGGVWFVDTDFLHGWFFFKPQQFALVCNQVREAGHKGWGISLTVEPVQDDVWSVGKPLSIMSASIRFDSSPTNRNVRKSEP
jgi:hypothetical protein